MKTPHLTVTMLDSITDRRHYEVHTNAPFTGFGVAYNRDETANSFEQVKGLNDAARQFMTELMELRCVDTGNEGLPLVASIAIAPDFEDRINGYMYMKIELTVVADSFAEELIQLILEVLHWQRDDVTIAILPR
jgi:hypothetical protein